MRHLILTLVCAGAILDARVLDVQSGLVQSWREGRDRYVSPDGIDGAPGSFDEPMSLAFALSDRSPAEPGDTLWLRGGTYRGTFVSELEGAPGAPIRVRPFPGERAVIDSAPSAAPALTVNGSWTVYWGFEITSSDPQRRSAQPGSWPSDLRRGSGIESHGPHNHFVNLVVHDLAAGLGIWSESEGSLAYGNLIFYNGWQGPDRPHGHGIYTQNRRGWREIAENIVFSQFSHGIHAYGSSEAYLNNITLRGNVVFNNGLISGDGPQRDILVGGGREAENIVIEENSTYGPAYSMLGYAAGCLETVVLANYLVGTDPLRLNHCTPTRLEGNTFHGAAAEFQRAHPRNDYISGTPSGVVVQVRPNRYEAGRAHVIVYNWDRRPVVDIDPAGVLDDDAPYEVRDVQNHAGPPVVSGFYRRGSVISIPVAGLEAAGAAGDVPAVPRHTAPEFAVFILRRVRSPEID
ncbi:MAG TPA: right-handed parallel beta-helix repeat-containing protein [Vicinamibacterales bacterium]|nr:right-handed parallel beta-helix repeat-containing protein [Vicinamibacterales bacterium]